MCKNHFLKIEIKARAALCCISQCYLLIIAVAAGLLFRFFLGRLCWNWVLWRETKKVLVYLCSSPRSGAAMSHWLVVLPLDLAACSSGRMKTWLLPRFRYRSFLSCMHCLLPFTTNSQPLLVPNKLLLCIFCLWHCWECSYEVALIPKEKLVDNYTWNVSVIFFSSWSHMTV